jgi:hypothetical protein
MSNTTQKPEKIASALYLITSFFLDQEPVKWKLRSLASDLVSLGVSLYSSLFKEREAARMETRSVVLEMVSLLAVTKNAGLISEANHSLLNQELLKYLENLGFPAGLREENGVPVLSQNFFASEEKEPKPIENHEPFLIKNKIHEEPVSYLPSLPKQEVQKEEREKPLKEFGAVSVKKNSRQSIIIGLLKRKKEVMIKDISPLISGCSEKTIQRELMAMVQAGILRKTGEKRWSRYSLA